MHNYRFSISMSPTLGNMYAFQTLNCNLLLIHCDNNISTYKVKMTCIVNVDYPSHCTNSDRTTNDNGRHVDMSLSPGVRRPLNGTDEVKGQPGFDQHALPGLEIRVKLCGCQSLASRRWGQTEGQCNTNHMYMKWDILLTYGTSLV